MENLYSEIHSLLGEVIASIDNRSYCEDDLIAYVNDSLSCLCELLYSKFEHSNS